MKLKLNLEKPLVWALIGLGVLIVAALAIRWLLRKFREANAQTARVDGKVEQLRADCATVLKAIHEENKASVKVIAESITAPKLLADLERLPKGKAGFAQIDPLPTPMAL